MRSVLFLQSAENDPYGVYREMLWAGPFHRDEKAGITAVYRYEECKAILDHCHASIPPISLDGLNEAALALAGRLVRIANPPLHAVARRVAIAMFQQVKDCSAAVLLQGLFEDAGIGGERGGRGGQLDGGRRPGETGHQTIDWVALAGKQLPVQLLLRGLGFLSAERVFISERIGRLTKIMRPVKTTEDIAEINELAIPLYALFERHIQRSPFLRKVVDGLVAETHREEQEIRSSCISNLAGLLIQSYDACRGLLSNAMLQWLRRREEYQALAKDERGLQDFVMEVIRFDPPVHNTQRIATQRFQLGGRTFEAGDRILLVLAAANRDGEHFLHADTFDITRINNTDQLTFGSGPHACLARDFAVRMTCEALAWIEERYPQATLLFDDITCEPVLNCRLPKEMIISLT